MNIQEIKDKRVILRADFNVPINNGIIQDDNKIKETLPTINLLLNNNNKIVIITHLGRPEGKFNNNLKIYPIKKRLEELLNKKINKINLNNKNFSGDLHILENIRFYKEEEENNDNFSKEISQLGEVYVNDAFGVSHREHASITGIQKYLPSFQGLLVKKEVENLKKIQHPERPFAVILGGKKEDKLNFIENILDKVDIILMGSYFGKLFTEEKNDVIKSIKKKCKEKNIKIIIPCKDEIYDINENTINKFKENLKDIKTVFWNGPLGYYEKEEFSKGTLKILKYLSETNSKVIVGGGELGAICLKINKNSKNVYVSTGGGAALKFLSEGNLVGIKDLK